jgi:hypothetical protein
MLTFVVGIPVLAACGLHLPGRSPMWLSSTSSAVALVVEGSAFRRPGTREEVVIAVERATGRRAVIVPGFSTAMDRTRERLASRLAKERPRVAGYDWKEHRCAADAVTLSALDAGFAGGYRVKLDYATRMRKASRGPSDKAGARRRNVLEARLTGTVALSAFTETSPARPITVSRTATARTGRASPGIDIQALVIEAVQKLPSLREPDWDGFARRLLKSGCPLLAVAVAETRLHTKATRAGIRIEALTLMERSGPERVVGERPADQRPGRVQAPRVAAREPESPSKTKSRAADIYSCSDLCGLHMVELCNNDKLLWSYYRGKWEPTPCGTKREDPFLTECYEQQWASGTFRDSCVTPCESDPEGRERLRDMLEGAGCFTDGASRSTVKAAAEKSGARSR